MDPRTDAVRRDLADIRLAHRFFAPHYAAPTLHKVEAPATLRTARDIESEVLTTLAAGDSFEMLELSAGLAWGRAPAAGLVGYIDASKLRSAA